MTKRPPIPVIVLVIILCFVLGLLNVVLDNSDNTLSSTSTPTPSVLSENPSDLRSVLIVGVDNLESPSPSLRAVWVLLYQISSDSLYLHGLPLDAKSGGDGTETLRDLFAWSIEDGLDEDFTQELLRILPLSPDLIVVNDETAFASAVNYLGGVEIEGKSLDGESVIAFLSLSWEKPEILLNNQALLLEALVPKALASSPTPELTDLAELIPEHVYISLDVTEAVALMNPLRKISPDNIFFILVD